MSLEAICWAYELEHTKGTEKFILVTLADLCDEWGGCYPSVAYLSKRTGISPSTVRGHLAKLEEKGTIRRETRLRENGSQRSNTYYLPVDQGGSVFRPPPDPGPLEPSLTSKDEKENGSRAPELDPPRLADPPPDEFETFMADYREVTGRSRVVGSAAARRLFNGRRDEGFELEELKLATRGAHGDEWMVANGRDVPETILRGDKVTRYIELARQKGHSADPPMTREVPGLPGTVVPQISHDGGATWETDYDALEAGRKAGR